MKGYIKNGARILFDYVMSLVVFVIFLYVFLSLAKDNFGKWMPLYSILIFVFMFFVVYTELKGLAIKEKKPQYELNPYPLKGLVYGLIGIFPVALTVIILSLISLGNAVADHIKHLAINTLLGPMYFLIKWMGESTAGYAAGLLLLPFITMLGYLAGYYGIEILSKIKKKKVVQEKGFTKSPWNPSNNETQKTGRKSGRKTGKKNG